MRPVRPIGNLPDQDQPDGHHPVVLMECLAGAAISRAKSHPEQATTIELISADHY